MPNHFMIYDTATGGANYLSHETDDARQRLTDAQLTALGKTRVSVDGPLLTTEQWNASTHQKESRVKPQAEKDRTANRDRLRTIASKGGKNLTQQDRDELLCLRTLMDLGEL